MIIIDEKKKYRNVFILESIHWWASCTDFFDPQQDLVLTYDTGLLKKITQLGGNALYIDHLVDQHTMQENNFLIYKFFKDWHLDIQGHDIFTYRGVPFGFAFRLEIWNDFTSYIRHSLCIKRIEELTFEAIFVGTGNGLVESILKEIKISFFPVLPTYNNSYTSYFFPIYKWMDTRLRERKFKHKFRDLMTQLQGFFIGYVDKIIGRKNKSALFIQEYYPTTDLLRCMKKDSRLRLVLAHFSWSSSYLKYFTERPIPVWGNVDNFSDQAQSLIQAFRQNRCSRLVLTNGVDVTESVYKIIDERISGRISETLLALDCVIKYLDKNPVKLAVLIANIGQVATMVDCVCRARAIPTYLIINGYMSGDFLDESKYASLINAYSISIKENYYRSMSNVVALGDPRMDLYAHTHNKRLVNRDSPTITIGTSAHSVIDLNSYLAVEFDFMYDILSALKIIREQGIEAKVILKVRSNGYKKQYQDFAQEFFPGLVDEIVDKISIVKVLEKTDFYISLYSQTLFEASCLGIPCLYYKNDSEVIDPPFDGDSELVTVNNVNDLVNAIIDFRNADPRYDSFMNKSVMEKYIGKLDGRNLERNLQCIHNLVNL